MPAQSGAAIVLGYRPQPAQAQAGGTVALDYADAAVASRTLRAKCTAPWVITRSTSLRLELRIAPVTISDTAKRVPWQVARPQTSSSTAPWGVSATADRAAVAPWGAYAHHRAAESRAPWGVASTADRSAVVPWGRYSARPAGTATPSWRPAYRADDVLVMPWGVYRPSAHDLVVVVNSSHPLNPWARLPWVRYSRPLNPGWGVVVDSGEPPTDEHGTVLVPIRSTYIVINEAHLTLAATGEPIQHTGLSLQLDVDSWAWGWSASVPASYLAQLRPDGSDGFVEVIATINGEPFRLLVETLTRDRRFGRADLRIGGRSRSAWLASPHAPTLTRYNTEARTAQQLLEDALTMNGVSIGWAVDWQITDWLVPAGAWSHQGSYIDAAVRIAEAAGAVIQPHPTAPTLRVRHRYPATPWEWPDATPDIALPEDVVTVEGITWADKPRYDVVYLAGSIMGHVKRTGTSGGTVAPMVTDPLLTHADATRQRGRAILADTGRQAQIRLALPVLEETGIIQPGTFIQYTEQGVAHRGITRAVDVQCGWPAITQTITVETHELEPV